MLYYVNLPNFDPRTPNGGDTVPFTFYPKITSEASLPVYVTGVGIGIEISSPKLPFPAPLLIVTLSGGGYIETGGKRLHIPEGCGIYIAHGTEYTVEVSGNSGWTVDCLSFETHGEELCRALFIGESCAYFNFKRPAMVSEDIRRIAEATSKDPVYGGFFASGALYSMLIELNRELLDLPAGHERYNPAVCAAISYIDAHYAENLTLEELCRVAGGLSEQYFCRVFKQHTGTRPVEYILRKRIGVARSYLERTDIPISEVAKMTGFNNASYFYRNFKKFTGVSPLGCRQSAMSIGTLSDG